MYDRVTENDQILCTLRGGWAEPGGQPTPWPGERRREGKGRGRRRGRPRGGKDQEGLRRRGVVVLGGGKREKGKGEQSGERGEEDGRGEPGGGTEEEGMGEGGRWVTMPPLLTLQQSNS